MYQQTNSVTLRHPADITVVHSFTIITTTTVGVVGWGGIFHSSALGLGTPLIRRDWGTGQRREPVKYFGVDRILSAWALFRGLAQRAVGQCGTAGIFCPHFEGGQQRSSATLQDECYIEAGLAHL